MNVINIALKELKVNLRDFRTFVFMLAFPIVLMLILGTALTNAFTSGATVGDMSLLYRNTASSPQLTQAWNEFSSVLEQQGVKLVAASASEDGKADVQDNQYSGYAEITDNGIRFYGSQRDSIESNIIQGMLSAFADRYNLAAAAMKENPTQAQTILAGASAQQSYVNESSLTAESQPGSMGYYAIAMTTMIAFYSVISGSNLIRGEKTRNTALRLSAAPVSKGSIFAGKVIGVTIVNFLCVVAVVLFSKFAYNADWGTHYPTLLLILFTEVLLAVSVGVGASYLFKGESSRSFVMIFTQIASFLGGAYFPVDPKGVMNVLSNISPMRWANEALTKIIYQGNLQAAWPALGLNIGVAAVFLIVAALFMRRQEAI
ncbi:ABC transporter permease [Cohnella zeiphila]|uniref:ABC transporter permease n=1 Tax=Cohnella zeiphila TaxID=2761120 RepID=A0A7X0VY08_9BACL|nr:ABC transporter permease [Cohnella zeiphila]